MTGNVEKVIKVSREKYAKDREIVEDKISRWHANIDEPEKAEKPKFREPARAFENKKVIAPAPAKQNYSQSEYKEEYKKESVASQIPAPRANKTDYIANTFVQREEIFKYKAICHDCKEETQVSFKPDGIRPVYCKNCLKKSRDSKNANQLARLKAKEEELQKIQAEEIPLRLAVEKKPVFFNSKNMQNSPAAAGKSHEPEMVKPDLESGTILSEDEEIQINN
jgi:CxxC-x17-CxxC domain-containing protein